MLNLHVRKMTVSVMDILVRTHELLRIGNLVPWYKAADDTR